MINSNKEYIESLQDKVYSKVYEVYDIFKDFFGEDKVDLQGVFSKEDLYLTVKDYYVGSLVGNEETKYEFIKDFNFEDRSNIGNNKIIERIRNILYSTENLPYILVYFNKVRVTNEYDKFVDIKDLYAKVSILTSGALESGFKLNRATYTRNHIRHDYMHSHVSNIPTWDFTQFQSPCTGRGPINHTMASLNRGFDKSLWELFCLELSKYVTVESISGVPYHRLETLGNYDNTLNFRSDFRPCSSSRDMELSKKNIYNDFIPYLLKNWDIKFSYTGNAITIAEKYIPFVVKVSNLFIDWYNTEYIKGNYNEDLNDLLDSNVICKTKIANDKIYLPDGSIRYNISSYEGSPMCTFKGKAVNIHIESESTDIEDDNFTYLLNLNFIDLLLDKVLKVLNYNYGKSSEKASDSTGKKVRYI